MTRSNYTNVVDLKVDLTEPRPEWPGVHPAAWLVPEMDDAEFVDLMRSITERGLLTPILVMPDGRILDGRSRWRACEQRFVTIRTETYVGDDPYGEVLARNVHRRHLTTAQVVAAVTKVMLERGERTANGRWRKGAAAQAIADCGKFSTLSTAAAKRQLSKLGVVVDRDVKDGADTLGAVCRGVASVDAAHKSATAANRADAAAAAAKVERRKGRPALAVVRSSVVADADDVDVAADVPEVEPEPEPEPNAGRNPKVVALTQALLNTLNRLHDSVVTRIAFADLCDADQGDVVSRYDDLCNEIACMGRWIDGTTS